MNICFVLEHFFPHVGGAETVFYEYVKRLSERGHIVRVVTSDSGSIKGEHSLFLNVTVYYYNSLNFFGHPILSQKTIDAHVKWADIVHTTTYTAAIPAIIATKKNKKPCLITVHEIIGNKWFSVEKNPIKALLFCIFEKFVITRKFYFWHVISDTTKKRLENTGVDHKKIVMIYHGIDNDKWNDTIQSSDIHKYLNISKDKKVFLYSGRPGKTKGLHILLAAIKKIDKKLNPNIHFGLLLSNDPASEKIKIENYIHRNKLRHRVAVQEAARYDELPGLRKAATAVIVPSLTEGFGFNAAETCAIGTPLITSDADSLPEVISGKVLVFKSGNIESLAEKIILASKGKFDILPQKSFSWDIATEQMEKIYKKLIKQRNA